MSVAIPSHLRKSPDTLLALFQLDPNRRRQLAVKQPGGLPRRGMSRFVILIALLSAIMMVSEPSQAAAQTTKTWNTTSPNWHTASGWTSPGVPGTNDTALFDINTTDTVTWNAITGNRTAGRLDVFAGSYTFNNITATPFELSLTSPAFSPFRVLGTDTTMNINGLHINATASNVLIDNAATVNVRVGSGPGIFSIGRITSSSFLRNNGTLNISLGSIVSNTSGSIASAPFSGGTTTVSGVGSTWNNSLSLRVGEGGFGTLNVLAGGAVTSGSPDVNGANSVIGFSAGSTGTVTVSGPGSMWSNLANLEVGRTGTGILNIENGGVVTNTAGSIGQIEGSTGTATVTGINSQWNNSENLDVGSNGTGTLLIESGGVVSNFIGVVGNTDSSDGSATVSGIGSQWNSMVNLIVGLGGSGDLVIENGGVVSNSVGFLANSATSSGTVTVSGPDSQWNNSQQLFVATNGIGILNIENGGAVVAVDNCSLGRFLGASGTMTVENIGSSWTSNFLRVGEGGNGALNVENGGSVAIGDTLVVGDKPGSSGNAILAGNQTQLTAFRLVAGKQGNGVFIIEDQATASCGQTEIGAEPGSNGRLMVGTDNPFPDGLLENSGDILIGGAGIGILQIESEGMVLVNGVLDNSPESRVEMDGGFLQVDGGIGNGGLLELAGNALIVADLVNFAEIRTVGSSDVLCLGDLLHGGTFIETAAGSRTRIAGRAEGVGPYTGTGLVQFDGRFEPGVLGPGQISFDGDVTLSSGAALQIQLSGIGPNSIDRLLIDGAFTIEPQRTLEVGQINGFTISSGQQFVIVEVGTTLTGLFEGLNNGSLVGTFGDHDLFITYAGGDGNDIVLYTIGVLGDVNGDGVVSLLDIAPFVNALTSGIFDPEADINQDGVVNLLDVNPFVDLLTG